jgi:hypothetical protein
MNNNSILLLDPNFEPVNSPNLSLLVKIGVDSFSYAILDNERQFVHAVYDEQECESGFEKLTERLKSDAYLQLSYKEVKVASHTPNVVFVPQPLFEKENVSLYTKYFADDDANNVYVQPHPEQGFNSIFALPAAAEKVIGDTWQTHTKLLQNAGLITLATTQKEDAVVIDFTVGAFQFMYLKDGLVAFMQCYQFEHADELTYYLLLIADQLAINTKHTRVKVCGIINEGDNNWNCLLQYFNDVDLLVLNSTLDTNILDDMPAHYYTSLLALQQCG